ncbi:MAG: hypothetical protein GXO00_00445 [Candidatus Diapherotrites archaeon]|nr:hypothetical protein [Candidatus Diapherotrites archaeon]
MVSTEVILYKLQEGLLAGIWAFIIAVVGYIIATIVERLVVKAYRYFGIRDYMEATGYERAVLGIEFETILKELAKWWVFLVFLAQAAAVLNLMTVTYFFSTLLNAFTLLAIAIIYFSAGAILAHYVGEKLREAGVAGGNFTVLLVKAVILYISAVTALQIIGFTGVNFLNRVVELLITALVIAFGLGVGIAIGLGGQETAKEIIEKHKAKLKKLFK